MLPHHPFDYHSLEDLKEEIQQSHTGIPVTEDLRILGMRLQAGKLRAPNRMVVLPMEGCDGLADGSPDELTLRRYRRFAAGGAGMLWVEACAVTPEGRANPRQLWIRDCNIAAYRAMVDEIHQSAAETMGKRHRPLLVLQLTHSGRYSKPGPKPTPIIAHHSKFLDPIHNLAPDYPLISDDELERLEDKYVEAARCAYEAGFDVVDVKACHRYLISELHASFTRGNSKYGGPLFENRTRLFRNIVCKIRDNVPGIAVTSRMNAYDAMPYPYGWGVDKDDYTKPDLGEPVKLASFLQTHGAPFLNITIGNPYFNPYINRPFDLPVAGAPVPPEHPLEGVARFMKVVRSMQMEVPELPIIGGGLTWLRQYFPNVAAAAIHDGWMAMAGAGRMAFAYPDFARDILMHGKLDSSRVCVACSACTQIMRDGGRSGCVPKDAEVYEPIYKAGRAEALDTITAMAKGCRQCAEPTCVSKCPAHVNVPKFVGEIATGKFREAYETLRESNLLAATCGYVCPSETLCESGCINEHYTESVPIRHLQRWVSRKAVEEGWAAEPRTAEGATGKRIAVIGAGPAGIAGAVKLSSLGHLVTIFEKSKEDGGMAKETIPAERMPDPILDREIQSVIASAGNIDRKSATVNNLDSVFDQGYDAVLLAPGLNRSVALQSPVRPESGVRSALEFLAATKHGEKVSGSVLVLGGGNTAIDAALSAKRAGASDVAIVYRRSFAEMPAWPVERDEAMNEGVDFLILTQPLAYIAGEDGRLTGVKVARTRLGEPDESGRRSPKVVAGSEHVMPADLVVEAIGQKADRGLVDAMTGVEFTRDGLVRKAGLDSLATSRPGVYAAGDIVNGGTTVVQAVAEGMQAAREMDAWLGEK